MQTVVYVSATDELGGSDQSLFELVQAIDSTRYAPHVVLPHDGPFAARYRALGVPVHIVPLQKLKNTRDPRWHVGWLCRAPLRIVRLLRLFRRLSPHVVHINTSVEALAGLAAAFYCRRRGRRLVWHVREMQLRPRIVEKALFGLVRRLANVVIAISTPVAAKVQRRERIYVIPNGLDLSRFKPLARPEGEPPTLGWVGRIAPGKGLEHVLDVFAAVRRRLPETRLCVMGAAVAGHESLAAALRARADAMGGVTWLPPGPATELAYQRMDLFVLLPDIDEGLGRTALEAQACGVPVVAWPRGGLIDAVKDARTGVFVPAGDVAGAAAAAEALLRDPAARSAMGIAAAAFASRRFGRDRCARAIERTYEESLS